MAIIPNTDPEILNVSSIIGSIKPDGSGLSTDLGSVVAMAKTGGKNATSQVDGHAYKSAFKFKETGDYAGDGELVDGALPYWSIWANNQPGEWSTSNASNRMLRLRLKRDGSDVVRFNLGDFRGHNTNASAPGIKDVSRTFTQGQNSGIIKDYAIAVNAHLGEYEWSKVNSAVTHWQVWVMDGENVIAKSSPTPVSTGSAIFSVVFPIIGTSVVRKDVYETRVYIGNGVNDFTDIGYIPGTGSITIEIQKEVIRYKLSVGVDGVLGNPFRIQSKYGTDGNTYTFEATYNTTFPSSATMGKRLYEATYKLVDMNTNTVKERLDITSNFTDEGPSTLDGWTTSFNREIFAISSRRMIASIIPGVNEQVQVSFRYR